MGRYLAILRAPHVAVLLGATTFGRVPFAINGLAVLLFLREVTGSFAAAGAGAGALALGAGVGAPFVARIVDRRGAMVLVPLAVLHAGFVVALVALGNSGATLPALIASAAMMGVTYPPSGSVLRARWPELLGGDPALIRTAYALDSVTIELSFVTGPLVTAAIVAVSGADVALLIAALLVVAGTALFVWALPGTEPVAEHDRHGGFLGALSAPAVRIVALTTVPVGFCIGAIEVALPAFSHAEGREELAGVLLAVWSASSGAGGIIYGARVISTPIRDMYLLMALVFPLACLPLVLGFSPLTIAVLAILAGLPIAPLIATRNELLADIAPAGVGIEAFTWLITSLVGGLSVGAAVAGALAEAQGWRAAVIAGVVVASAGALASVLGRERLRPEPAVAT